MCKIEIKFWMIKAVLIAGLMLSFVVHMIIIIIIFAFMPTTRLTYYIFGMFCSYEQYRFIIYGIIDYRAPT